MIKNLVSGLVISIVFASCTYDNKEDLYPDLMLNCDTSSVSYAETIVPILTSYCFACHSNSNAPIIADNIKLEDYADLKVYIEDGRFFGALNRDAGYTPMPYNSSKLDDCKILKIKVWIDQGYPEN